MTPVILHIPHASTLIPDEELPSYVVSREALDRQNLLLADMHTDDLYHLEGARRAVFPVSRFVVDPERFGNDEQEPMASRGMGAIYTVTTDLEPLRPCPSPEKRRSLMERYYWPHHQMLDRLSAEILDRFGRCLIIDCHSYPSVRLPYEEPGLPRPEIGIGTDARHTPAELRDVLSGAFKGMGYEVGVDTPFSGALVPNAFYGRDLRVSSIMIEVRRDLYMDENTGEKGADFMKVRHDITRAIEHAAESLLGPFISR